MATVGIISIGLLVDSAKVSEGFQKAGGIISNFSQSLGATVGGLKTGTAAIVGLAAGVGVAAANLFQATSSSVVAGVEKIASGLVQCVAAGSDLSESVSKTGVIFGDSDGIVTAVADKMADRFGMVKSKTLEAASDIGQIAKASKLSESAAARLSSQFVQIAGDVSSISNTQFIDVLGAIKSGMVGEAEPLRKFGVLLSEQAVKSRAASMGLMKLGQDLDEATKVQARAAIIADQLSYAQGDLERTQFGVANSSRSAAGRIENLKAEFGQLLAPIAETGLALANFTVSSITDQISESKSAITSFIEAVAGSSGFLVQAFVYVGQSIGALLDTLQLVSATAKIAGVALVAAFDPVIQTFKFLARNASIINAILAMSAPITTAGVNFGASVASGAIKDTMSSIGEPPPSTQWNAWIQSIADKATAAIDTFRQKANVPITLPETPSPEASDENGVKALLVGPKRYADQAKRIWESQLDPVEKLAMKLAEINDLEREGFLTAEQSARARAGEAASFAAMNVSRKLGAAGLGSAESYKAIVSHRGDRSDPMRSLPNLAETGNRILADQRELLKMIAAKTGGADSSVGSTDETIMMLAN